MAYEDMTYEYIINRMIERITNDYPDLDVREGSMVFNAVASAAMEVSIMYAELDNVLKESFVETASREFILIGCEQMGIDTTVFEASNGIYKGVFNLPVGIDSRWNLGLYNYIVVDQLPDENGMYAYRLQCETEGSEPNAFLGDLTPIDFVSGDLTTAKLTECLIEGEDETPDEDIRQYYFDYVKGTAIDGNIAQYEQWCADYEGIGNYKIIPLWNGNNTVKVSILSVSNRKASDELINNFQNYLDPGTTGMGDGIAPIGSFVTVSTATEVPLNISATVKLKDGYNDTSVIGTAITNYLESVAYKANTIPYMKLGAIILDAEGVDFITNLKVNGGTSDITLSGERIAVLGTTNWTVSS